MVANERDLQQVENGEVDEEIDDESIDEFDDELVDLDALDEDEDAELVDEEGGDEEDESESESEAEEDDEEDDADQAVASHSESTSLEELLDQRSAALRGTDDPDEDEDFSALTTETTRAESRARSKVAPLRNREEFVCKRCFLLKPKVQLADPERMLCRDCV